MMLHRERTWARMNANTEIDINTNNNN